MESSESSEHGTKTRRMGARLRDVAILKSCDDVVPVPIGDGIFSTIELRVSRDDSLDKSDTRNLRVGCGKTLDHSSSDAADLCKDRLQLPE